ncbi:uncharacterized protein [Rutidosis leptorrhynchoides]|uniref:uncharacterized protein n=1 Tax=Rutidosis leptorrhynchoides TaxID=125765 RepID=UPI003A99458F
MGLSKVGPANQQYTALVTGVVGTIGYLDPVYLEMGILTKESDVYSFGVVLMEVLSGKLCYQKNINGTFSTLVQKWKKICKTGRLDEIVFQDVVQPLDPDSLEILSRIAFKCLNKNLENRPLIYHVVKELEATLELQEPHDLKIPKEYEEIKYKSIEGSEEHQWQNGSKTYSGLNIKGSLTSSYKCFTLEEIKMATKGFSDLLGEGAIGKVFCGHISGVLHRDIKSANILLDDEWNAKVADLGLSKVGPANQQHTALVTGVVGTIGYLDPVYWQLGLLTKESDVYSFGVVLMEVLTGKLCYQKNSNGTFSTLVQKWKKICKTGRADEIVFRDVMQPLAPDSLKIFSGIAFKCLNKNRENRPLMYHVVKELEAALELQEPHDLKQPKEYEEIKYKSIEVSKEHQWQNGGKTYSGINIQQGSLTSYYKCFTLGEIKMATKGFSDLLGQGAIGKVFCGEISGSRYDGLVAVKRWKESSNHRQDEFQKEIEMLSACNHPNIISLIGCCDEGSEKILVYDFMKNGSLYDCLHSNRELTPRMSVEQRVEICLGVAKGLSYLHYGSQYYIIHSDIKSINILLDADLVPKISNFRLSKTRADGTSSSDVVTNTIEVLCERSAWERLVMLALPYIWRRQLPEFTPEYVAMNISPGCSRVCVYIIKDCLDNNPDNRPTINQVVDNLKSALKLQKQESYFFILESLIPSKGKNVNSPLS